MSAGSVGAGSVGAGSVGAGSVGAGSVGAGSVGAGSVGAGSVGAGSVGAGIRVTPFDDPVAAALIDAVQREYLVRYGGPDETPTDPAEFAPPRGLFLVAFLDGLPAGCGGWRAGGDGSVEVKRMFTVEEARGRGVARAVLAEIERTAAAAGHDRVVLETGWRQPEAIALYLSSGYAPIAPFGHYAAAPGARHLGKSLS